MAKKPVLGEVKIARGENIWEYWEIRPNPNDFFGKLTGRTLTSHVEHMLKTDAHLSSVLQTRKRAVISLDRRIVGQNEEDGKEDKIAAFVREEFAGIQNFSAKLYDMLSALEVGFSIVEVIWKQRADGKIGIEDLKARCQDIFVFDKDNNLRLLTKEAPLEGIPVPERKFLVFTFDPKYGNPYGTSLLQQVYWPWFFKKHGIKFWAIFVEKFAIPTVVARIPEGVSEEDEEKVKRFIEKIKVATGVTVPEGIIFDLLEANKKGTVQTYNDFINFMNAEISKGILGQTLTTQEGKVGSYALAKVHENVRLDILEADADFLASVINDQLIRWLVDWNFPNVESYPKFEIITEYGEDLEHEAKVLKHIYDMGLEIPKKYLYKKFGIPQPEKDEEVVVKKGGGGGIPPFSEFSEDDVKKKSLRELLRLRGMKEE